MKQNVFTEEYPINSCQRKYKIELLKTIFKNQQMNISSSSKESNITTETSFIITWNIAKSKDLYTDGELISNISVTRHTTERRISEISVEVEQHLLNDLKNCEAFRIALDESTDIQDKPQTAVFVRYVTSDVLVKEELLDLVELKDTTREIDLKEALDTVLVKANTSKNKLVSVATDGATAMVGKHIGLLGLLNSDPTYPEFIPVHCVIHQEHLAAKHFNFPIIFKLVLEIVNYIQSNAKNHRQCYNLKNNAI
ncbi:protein FAM200A-like [Hydra vulgaris]|uniref:Protein FAM200A-like n=1 Tax=Hydra vulgaris TaxID=6087 RepID=A0ABM4D0X0_HYDVU